MANLYIASSLWGLTLFNEPAVASTRCTNTLESDTPELRMHSSNTSKFESKSDDTQELRFVIVQSGRGRRWKEHEG